MAKILKSMALVSFLMWHASALGLPVGWHSVKGKLMVSPKISYFELENSWSAKVMIYSAGAAEMDSRVDSTRGASLAAFHITECNARRAGCRGEKFSVVFNDPSVVFKDPEGTSTTQVRAVASGASLNHMFIVPAGLIAILSMSFAMGGHAPRPLFLLAMMMLFLALSAAGISPPVGSTGKYQIRACIFPNGYERNPNMCKGTVDVNQEAGSFNGSMSSWFNVLSSVSFEGTVENVSTGIIPQEYVNLAAGGKLKLDGTGAALQISTDALGSKTVSGIYPFGPLEMFTEDTNAMPFFCLTFSDKTSTAIAVQQWRKTWDGQSFCSSRPVVMMWHKDSCSTPFTEFDLTTATKYYEGTFEDCNMASTSSAYRSYDESAMWLFVPALAFFF